MKTKIKYCGIDICKQRLDVSCDGKYKQYPNSRDGIKQLIKEFKSKDSTLHLVYESTGRLSAPIHMWIRDSKVAQSMLNPAHVRYYAKSIGVDAKTDKKDAEVLASFASSIKPEDDKVKSDIVYELRELYTHLDLIISNRTRHKNELSESLCTFVRRSVVRSIKEYNKEIKKVTDRIKELINKDEGLKERYDTYISEFGIGERGAMTLTILMPELGYLNRNQVASLVGVAPFNHESGSMKGKRSIRGGRKRVRSILYLCVLSAIRKEGELQTFYRIAVERGKSKRGTIIACIRKLLIHLNSTIKDKKNKEVSIEI